MQVDWSTWSGIATVLGVIGTGLLRLWGAIKKRFDRVAQDRVEQIKELRRGLEKIIEEHEVKNAERHHDNTTTITAIQRELTSVGRALTALGWRTNGHLKGERGERGERGKPGDKGEKGDDGDNG